MHSVCSAQLNKTGNRWQLASCRFDQIGAVYEGTEDEEFVIGKELVTGRGPWSSASAYYSDLVKHVMNACVRDARPAIPGFYLPVVFEYLISIQYMTRTIIMGPLH